jgi:hypothetical protein
VQQKIPSSGDCCVCGFYGEPFLEKWTPGEVIFGCRVLRNNLALCSITLLIDDETLASIIKLV